MKKYSAYDFHPTFSLVFYIYDYGYCYRFKRCGFYEERRLVYVNINPNLSKNQHELIKNTVCRSI